MPQSKRSVTGSSDSKILSKSPASNLSEMAMTDACDSSPNKSKQQKIISKSLIFEFESASEDLAGSASDLPLLLSDLESSIIDQDLMSWISPLPAISSKVVQGGGGSGKIVVSMESPEVVVVTDLLKESIIEFKSSAKVLDALKEFGEGFGVDSRVQGGSRSGKIVVSVESPEVVVVIDLLKESIIEFKSLAKVLDALMADLGDGERSM